MASIAFFSDDATGSQCALMTAIGLAEIGVRTVLALGSEAERARVGGRPDAVAVLDLGRSANAFDIERAASIASRAGADLVAAVPLARIGDAAVRAAFDAVVTVGGCQASAARALRAARYDVASTVAGSPTPAWFLARADQPLLMTKARLSASGGPRLPFATRTLPFAMPRLTPAESDGLLAWAPGDALLGTGVLLAALGLAIAAAPGAARLEAADLAAMMAIEPTSAEGGSAARLADLALAYARLTGDPCGETPPRVSGGSRDRRPPVAVPHRTTRGTTAGPVRRTRVA